MQISPPIELSHCIKHYLFLETSGKDSKNLRFFSDGNAGILFSLKNTQISEIKNHQIQSPLPKSFIYGQISEYKDICSTGEVSLIIVVFRPNGINQSLGIPAGKLLDSIIDIEAIFGKQGIQVQQKLCEQAKIQDRVRILNAFFKKLLSSKNTVKQPLITVSVNFISNHKGLFSVKQLSSFCNYSERHIERAFIECIGLTPKKFGNITRLHSFLKMLNNSHRHDNLTSISYEAGYSDQSHLIREFKRYTGITPKQYLYNTQKLAINFLRMPSGTGM